MVKGFEGHHSTPTGPLKVYGHLFRDYLPQWHPDGKFNFDLRANSQTGAIQMDGLLHKNAHKWLNDIAEKVIEEIKNLPTENEKSIALAKLVTFLEVAGDPRCSVPVSGGSGLG